jgi:hypothetical protein
MVPKLSLNKRAKIKNQRNTVTTCVGGREGSTEGIFDGATLGAVVGSKDGALDGSMEGAVEGLRLGCRLGNNEGVLEGEMEGRAEGIRVGFCEDPCEGSLEGDLEGTRELRKARKQILQWKCNKNMHSKIHYWNKITWEYNRTQSKDEQAGTQGTTLTGCCSAHYWVPR